MNSKVLTIHLWVRMIMRSDNEVLKSARVIFTLLGQLYQHDRMKDLQLVSRGCLRFE